MTEKTEIGAVKRYFVRKGELLQEQIESMYIQRTEVVLASDFDALIEQRDRMRAAFLKYAVHAHNCPAWIMPGDPCSCGLADALASSGERGK